MSGKEGVTAAIMAAIDQLEEEEAMAVAATPLPAPHPGLSPWKYQGLHEIMSMRILWQLRRGRRSPPKKEGVA
ncbi:MAG: hypothetical protein ACE5IE_05020 [Dehalococcoidia bacterium]